FLKFEKMLSSGDISINGQLNDEVAQKILNMQTIELYNFVSERKNHIVFKILQGSPDVDVAIKNLGIDFKIKDELLKDLNSYRLLKEMFLEHKQYEKLKKYVLSNDIKNIELVLQNVLSENQKKILLENKTDIEHLAKNLVNIGLYSPYNWRYIEKNWGDSTDRIQGTLTLDGKKSYKMSEVAFETPYKPDKSTEKLFKEVFKNLLFADINQEHNQIGDVINEINRNYKMPKTIINFDSHSDMYGQHAFQDGTIFIADWVNWALAQENVEKMIWVIPEESIKTNPSAKYLYFDYMPYHSHTLNGNFDHTQIPDYLGKTPFIQKIWIDRDNFLILPSLNNNKPQGNVKVVEFIMCTISSLPDLKNEDILLSLDGDYFHCSGYNTQGYISNMPIDINKTFKDFIEALYSKNIRPKFLNCSISVRYVGYERNDELYGFFKYILKISNKKDKIKGYVGKIGQNFTQKDITEISAF
ncbi:hypothetical protein IJ670_05715, partial [bacterium]|nr:hypothetical protein [bacterium]